MTDVLFPAKLAVKVLSKDSVNILECEAAVAFLLSTLDAQPSQLAKDLRYAIWDKIETRRNHALNSLVLYLSDPIDYQSQTVFTRTSVTVLNAFAVKMLERLFGNGAEELQEEPEILECEEPQPMSIEQRLVEVMRAANSSSNSNAIPTGRGVNYFRKEMQDFAKNKQRTPLLDSLLDALKTAQATSITPERNFSEAKHVASTVRNSLKDETLDCLTFLKAYFRNKDNDIYLF